MKHELCKVGDLPDHGSLIVPFFGREAHVYRVEGRPRAAVNICLHLGGPLEYRDGQFVCPWHGAAFDGTTGAWAKGPAPAQSRLMILPTRVEDGALFYVWGEA